MVRRTDITERFGRRLRGLRQRANFSQEEFAERCDLDRTYISGKVRSALMSAADYQSQIDRSER